MATIAKAQFTITDLYDGKDGSPGKGISSVTKYYLASASSSGVTTGTAGWTTTVQSITSTVRYLWSYDEITYTDSSTTTTTPAIIGVYGDQGASGPTGKGISSVTNYYLATAASSGVTTSTTGWTTTVQNVSATNKYLWNYEVITYTDATTTNVPPVIIGAYGDQGQQGNSGKGISSVTEYYLATSASSGVTTGTAGWTTTPQSVTSSNKYLWNYEKITYTDNSTSTTTPVIIGVYGDTGNTGKGVSAITNYYLATNSASGVTTATTGWTTTVQNASSGAKYLWNYEVITYTDNSTLTTVPCIIGAYGDTGASGKGISSVTNYYLATSASTGVTTGTVGWTTSVQSVTATNKYLWNYEVITYTDNSTASTLPVVIGAYGDQGQQGNPGKGISSVTEYYLASATASGITTATTGWTTAIQTLTATNRYLWNYEVITYTDNSTSTTTPVIIGVYGDKGDQGQQGQPGNPGKGVSSITKYYLASTASSGVTTGTAGWTTGMQSITSTVKYLWSYEVITYTDSSNTTTTPVIIGVYGDQGQQGGTGPSGKGISSLTNYYLATASSSGVTTGTAGWTTAVQSVTATNKYLWNYEVVTYTDGSTTTTTPCIIGAYGDQGQQGNAGKGVSSVTEYYLVSSSNSGVTTGTAGWTTTIQTVTSSNKYLWNYEKITYTDGSTSTTLPVVIGVYGDTGATGKGISSVTNYYLASSTSSGITTATAGWTTSIQSVTATNKYLWNYEVITYTDSSTTTTTPCIIGVYGDKGDQGQQGQPGSPGKGITSVTNYFLATSASSGVTTGTAGWTTTVQSVTSTNKYLWNYEVITYTDSSQTSTAPVVIGAYGDQGQQGGTGKGISAVTNYFLATSASSGVTTSTSGWTTTVQSVTSTNKYLWNYEVITYTDSSTTSTLPCIIGTYGDKGDKGDQGQQGPPGVAYMGTSAPTNPAPVAGSTWFQTDTSGNVITIQKYDGSKWVITKMTQDALSVTNLSALSANLGNVTAGSLTGVTYKAEQGTAGTVGYSKMSMDSRGANLVYVAGSDYDYTGKTITTYVKDGTFQVELYATDPSGSGLKKLVKVDEDSINIYSRKVLESGAGITGNTILSHGKLDLGGAIMNINPTNGDIQFDESLDLKTKSLKNVTDISTSTITAPSAGVTVQNGPLIVDRAMKLLYPYTTIYSAFTGSWVVYNGSPVYTYPAIYQTPDGMVHITGVMKNGSSGVVFYVVPSGLRPSSKKAFNINVGTGFKNGYVTLDTSGNMAIFLPASTDNVWVVLDGIEWYAN